MISLLYAAGHLGRYFRKQKRIFNEQKNAPNVFLI